MKNLNRVLHLALAAALCLSLASVGLAEIRREYVSVTIPDGETSSGESALRSSGTIKQASVRVSQGDVTTTVTLSAWLGSSVDPLPIATADVSTTTTTAVAGLAVPIAGEVRVSARTASAVDGDQDVEIVLMVEDLE